MASGAATDARRPKATNGVVPGTGEPTVTYRTDLGEMIEGTAEAALGSCLLNGYRCKVQLVLTSPPFPLNKKKRYGNLQGKPYADWLAAIAPLLRDMLTRTARS